MSQNPLLVSRNELAHRTIAALAPAHKALFVNYDCHLPDYSTLIVAAPDLYHLPQISTKYTHCFFNFGAGTKS